MAQLLETGFNRKRLADIKTEYDGLVTEALGAVNTNPDSVIGQLIGIFSEAIDNAEETLQNTYDAMYPSSAEGTSLDGAVSFVGLTRLPATETIVIAAAYGLEGTVVPTGTLAHSDIQYASVRDTTITRANALDVSIEVTTLTNSTAYNIFCGGVSQTYTSDASATKLEIATAFANLYNTGSFKTELLGDTFRIYSADGKTPFSITVDTKLTIKTVASPVTFAATVVGAYPCPIAALINVDTPVIGMDSLTNMAAGVTGNNVETDSELRARHALGVRGTGSATVEAIKARMLQDVPEVTGISIYENRTAFTNVDGLPPHSYESIVAGGADSDIGAELWLTKPAGIETHGNVTVNVTDTAGDVQTVKFSRAVTKYAWLRITIALYSEEVLPSAASIAIKQACLDYANQNIGVGNDIIIQRFYGAIYEAVSGIGSIGIEAAITNSTGDTPSYVSANIAIGKAENAVFDFSRISVSGV